MLTSAVLLIGLTPVVAAQASPATAQPVQAPVSPEKCSSKNPKEIKNFGSNGRGTMTRLFCNDDVVIYGDAGYQAVTGAQTEWVPEFMTDLWRYEKETYGSCATAPHSS